MDDERREKGKNASGQIDLNPLPSSKEDLFSLLCPLGKLKIVDLLAQLGSQYPFIAEEIRSVASADPALRKLFVRGLGWDTTSETLCAAFEEHGEIEESVVIFDKATGKSRGFGFITYKDMESAQKALKASGKMIDGRMAAVNLASDNTTTSTVDQISRKLYIGGLSPETTTEMLLDFFERHGEIEEGFVAYDKDLNKSRGFGFITYKTVEAARKAIEDPEKMLGGRSLTVKLADNKRGRGMQTQFPSAVVPVPIAMPATYPHARSMHSASVTPIGYTFPRPMPPYPSTGYTSQPVGVAAYAVRPQMPYPHFAFNTESPMASTSTGAYLNYAPRQ